MKASDEMYRRIVAAVPEGIWVVSNEGRTIFCNGRMASILGTSLESMPTMSCFDCVFPGEEAEAQVHFSRNMAGDCRPFDFRLRRADESAVWVSISCMPLYDDSGEAIALLGLFSDISERKRAEADLRESEERFRTMADTAPVMIWVCGPDKLCTFFSKGWLAFTGRAMEQELGQGWLERVHPDDADSCLATYSSSFEARRSFQMEYRLRRADGEYRLVLNNGVPRFEPGGGFAGYIGSCIDITQIKRAQEEAVARQKLESLGVLAGGIAHDFNNLLGGILTSAEVALAEIADGAPVHEELQNIRTTAIRGAEIVRQLMMHAGNESPAFEPLDISVLVHEMLQLLKISIPKHATLKTELRRDLPTVQASAAQLRQVVMNLVINAAEAIGEREGEIRITTALAAGSLGADGDYLQLEVSDTGSGMTPEVQAKIFDPFFSTKHAGRGLGLAAIQGIIRSHGGVVNVVSAPGQGSRFAILLPCDNRPAPATAHHAALAFNDDRGSVGATILLIEDEDPLRLAIAKMLRKGGYAVIEAADGHSAVELFRSRAHSIDVVLLDMTLPGKPGQEVLEELRRIRCEVKVILTTAYNENSALTAAGAQQPWYYLQKPYQFTELAALLRTACPPPG
jgi:two-component system cell cycle sensor histidine kinase/response regulator CckA